MKLSEFFSDESKWVKNYYAVQENGTPCTSCSIYAKRWCISGAVSLLKLPNYATKRLRESAVRLGIAKDWVGNQETNPIMVSLMATNDSLDFSTLIKWILDYENSVSGR